VGKRGGSALVVEGSGGGRFRGGGLKEGDCGGGGMSQVPGRPRLKVQGREADWIFLGEAFGRQGGGDVGD